MAAGKRPRELRRRERCVTKEARKAVHKDEAEVARVAKDASRHREERGRTGKRPEGLGMRVEEVFAEAGFNIRGH